MSSYVLKRTQKLPIDLDTAWDFFSSPHNLNDITPPDMQMHILNNSGTEKMFAGQIITYTVSPVLGIPLFWMTEIVHVKDKEYFVDNQLCGPFAIWHHLHQFKAIDGGVEMTDLVNYKLPLGPLGNLVHALIIKKRVEAIFNYRHIALQQKFGKL